MWAGLLVAFWLLLLFVAVIYCYMHDLDLSRASAAYARHNATIDAGTVAQYYWHNSAVGVGAAALGMVFIVGGVGLILGARWAWPVLVGGAGLQILFTVATQIWEATIPALRYNDYSDHGSPGLMGIVIGILLWNVIPVGILLLALGVQRQGKREAAAVSGA
jgi:uncharacterized membrane protein YkgB